MNKPAVQGAYSATRRWVLLLVGSAAMSLAVLGAILRSSPEPRIVPPSPSPASEAGTVRPSTPVVKARTPAPTFHPWPLKREIVGPPSGQSSSVPRRVRIEPTSPPSNTVPEEPPAPSRDELRKESERSGDQVTAEAAREILLDDARSSALKLAVIDKLRGQDPRKVVPVLLEFLEHPEGPGASMTKPTAVRILSEFRDPVAGQALAMLESTCRDERVRLTIAALKAKEKAR